MQIKYKQTKIIINKNKSQQKQANKILSKKKTDTNKNQISSSKN